jgi:formamidopyrimidine-DNA glycosylase
MPEGPEIWILSKAINKYYHFQKTTSYGKHLFVLDGEKGENWSFGLTGKVFITEDNSLIKKNVGKITGKIEHFSNYANYEKEMDKLGIDWFTGSKKEMEDEVKKWRNSKKKLAGLLLDQTKISGIGVAWGSEILHKAHLSPEDKACDQDLENLAKIMYELRESIKNKYLTILNSSNNKEFIVNWFENLYSIREMKIYKKGKQLSVLGRNWWI